MFSKGFRYIVKQIIPTWQAGAWRSSWARFEPIWWSSSKYEHGGEDNHDDDDDDDIDDGDDPDNEVDIYIMMKCVSVCNEKWSLS